MKIHVSECAGGWGLWGEDDQDRPIARGAFDGKLDPALLDLLREIARRVNLFDGLLKAADDAMAWFDSHTMGEPDMGRLDALHESIRVARRKEGRPS